MGKKRAKPTPESHWLRRLWHFIWYDDSLLSWAVNIVLAFVLIKFIVYPLLGLLFGTGLPLVAVISESMEHDAPFDEWWGECAADVCPRNAGQWYEDQGISKEEFSQYPLSSGFNRGDVILLVGADVDELEVGDIIVFSSGKPYPIIHRIVATQMENGDVSYVTKGDNNPQPIVSFDLNEENVQEEQLLGKAVFRIPFVGYLKLLVVDGLALFGV